jgi:hypothetical protein
MKCGYDLDMEGFWLIDKFRIRVAINGTLLTMQTRGIPKRADLGRGPG